VKAQSADWPDHASSPPSAFRRVTLKARYLRQAGLRTGAPSKMLDNASYASKSRPRFAIVGYLCRKARIAVAASLFWRTKRDTPQNRKKKQPSVNVIRRAAATQANRGASKPQMSCLCFKISNKRVGPQEGSQREGRTRHSNSLAVMVELLFNSIGRDSVFVFSG